MITLSISITEDSVQFDQVVILLVTEMGDYSTFLAHCVCAIVLYIYIFYRHCVSAIVLYIYTVYIYIYARQLP